MYFEGQSVFAHMDFRHYDREDENIASRLSFTLYLNDCFNNGETAFALGPIGLDGSHGGIYFKSVEAAGAWNIKYVCNTYVYIPGPGARRKAEYLVEPTFIKSSILSI
jgi:hypothetical protein